MTTERAPVRFETPKYVFSMWCAEDMIRATVRLSPNERRKRNSETLSINEIADQLKNVEKWRDLTEISRAVLETIAQR